MGRWQPGILCAALNVGILRFVASTCTRDILTSSSSRGVHISQLTSAPIQLPSSFFSSSSFLSHFCFKKKVKF